VQTEHKEPNSSLLLLENLGDRTISRESACETNSILDCLGDLLFIIDKNRIINKVNKSTCDTFKKKPEELIGRHCYEIVHGTEEPWCNCPATKTFETKQVTTEEINDPKLGIPLLVTTSAILDEHGEVAQVIHLAKDITEQEKAEERNLLLASIVDHSDDAIISKNLYGIITSWNIAAEKIYGYSAAEIIGKSIEVLAPSEEKDEIALILKRICAGEQIEKYETKRRRKDGAEIDVSLTVSPIKNKAGTIVGASTIARDITENKKAEEKIKESQKKYQITFDSSMDALMLLDEKGFFDCNKATLKLFKCPSVEAFTKLHPADLSPQTQPDGTPSMDAVMSHIQKAFQTGTDHFFWIHKRTDDATFPADVLLTRMTLKGREVLQATVRDVTERKKTEEIILKSETRYRELANFLPETVFEADLNGKVTFLSHQGFEKSGYTIQDLEKGLNMMQFVAPQDRDRAIKNTEQLIAGQDIGLNEYMLTAKDGTAYPALIKTATIISENKVTGVRGIVIDITERKKVEDALALSEVTFKAYLEGCPLAVFAANSDGKYEYVNDVAVKMLGYSREELLNMTTRQVVPKNDSRGSFRFNELKEKGYFAGVLKLRQKNGRIIDVSLNSCKCPDGKLVAFCEDITEKQEG